MGDLQRTILSWADPMGFKKLHRCVGKLLEGDAITALVKERPHRGAFLKAAIHPALELA
jgi:hypothetical protein